MKKEIKQKSKAKTKSKSQRNLHPMNLSEFNKNFSALTKQFRKGYYKNPNNFQIDVFAKIVDYQFQLWIISERLDTEINEAKKLENNLSELWKEGKEPNRALLKSYVLNLEKIKLDLSNFHIYTRIFLDYLTVSIKLSFLNKGNKNALLMDESAKVLINANTMRKYRDKIDSNFFSGLEEKVKWIIDFRTTRDGLVHISKRNYFVFTNNLQGELGYDIIGKIPKKWGTNTVKTITTDIQATINNLSELLKFINENLPK